MPCANNSTFGLCLSPLIRSATVAESSDSMAPSITPAIIVHMKSPSIPCFATMPEITTTKAPVGPPIWVIEPPSAEIRNPATTAQYKPDCGGTPEEIAKAIANGSATSPTVTPATRSLPNFRQL